MADLLREGTLSAGGRFISSVDLESTSYYLVRNSLGFERAEPQVISSEQAGRWGGTKQFGAKEGNLTMRATWRAHDPSGTAATPNLVAPRIESLLTTLDAAGADRYFEWRPEGLTFPPVYFERRGPAAFTTNYSREQHSIGQGMLIDVTCPVAPLGVGAAMDIYDPFDVDSIADFAYDESTGWTVSVGNGLVPPNTTLARLIHTARGYLISDAEHTAKFTTVTAPGTTGIIFKRIDALNYLRLTADGAGMYLHKVVAGVATQIATTASAGLVPNAGTRWIRVRMEGNVIYGEVFSAEPTYDTAPTAQLAAGAGYTLAGGAETNQFGSAVVGGHGLYLAAGATGMRVQYYKVEPYTYKKRTLPVTISLKGPIPGTERALARIKVTNASGQSAAPAWGAFGWNSTPGAGLSGSPAPVGPFEAETAFNNNLTGWAVTADAGASGGSMLKDATVVGAETYTASCAVDPNIVLDPDEFNVKRLVITFYARILLNPLLVGTRVGISHRSEDGNNFGTENFSLPWGSGGRPVTLPSAGNVFRRTRLGQMAFDIDPLRPRRRLLWLAASTAAGSSGVFGVDRIWAVPSHAHVASPSGEALVTFPKFIVSTSETERQINSDGTGLVALPPNNPSKGPALGGSTPIELPVGLVDFHADLAALVPDDPTVDTSTDTPINFTTTLHVPVTPRFRLLRSA